MTENSNEDTGSEHLGIAIAKVGLNKDPRQIVLYLIRTMKETSAKRARKWMWVPTQLL